MPIKIKIKCKDCGKLTTKDDFYRFENQLCDKCVSNRMANSMDRIRKTGKCGDCGKIIGEDDKEFFNMMGCCGDCFFTFKPEDNQKVKDKRIFGIRIRTGKGDRSSEEEINDSVETILDIGSMLENKFNGISMAKCKIHEDGTSLILQK